VQTKDKTLVNTVLALNDANYAKTARPAYYIEIYEGSIYEWQADPTTAVWNRIDCSTLNLNFQQGQSKTISASLPIELFRNAGGALEYDYDTGIYTGTDGSKLSKGFLIRAYSGYCDFTSPYTEHVKLRFTGIIESIVPNDDGIMEVNGVDFSVIFMNVLNYNYPDINSYRDLPWTDSTATITAPISATDQFIYVSDATLFSVGSKIKIDSEVMLVLNVTIAEAKLTVQRLSGVSTHAISPANKVYLGDEYLVMPDDVYNDSLLNKYVPAYDNWRLDYAIRDLCIKSKFPLNLLSIAYNDFATIRLGRADKYPYMQSKSIFERLLQANSGVAPKMDRDSYTGDGTTGYAPVIEKKVYAGIDEDMLNDAKFKLEFGQSLWDAILTLTEGFGFKVFFNEQGVLTIKAVRQYTWLAPSNGTEESQNSEIIENHVWSWTAWNIKALSTHRYTFDLTVGTIPTAASIRNLRVRFIANTSNTDSATIQLKKSDGGTWTNVGATITIPALKKYQYYEAEIYRATNADTAFVPDTYGVVMVAPLPTTAPYFNGLLYLDNNDEVISFTCDNTLNAIVSSAVNSSAEVRNQMTIIGLPESPQPIISRSIDTTSIYNGNNAIKGGSDGTITFSTGHVLMDGRYDKYALLKTSAPAIIELLTSNLNLMFVYLKPQTTPLGAIVSLKDATTHIVSHTVTANDLTSGGIMFKLPALYTQSTIELYCATDLYISEIECYEYDPAYNFVGHKKETIVVKKNISDKATSDWISLTQLEMHRRNIKQFSISSLSNPYIEIGDCGVVAAPEVGAFNDTRLWVTGISTEISRISSTDTLTVVALPPMQSYIKPPVPATQFLANKAYGFSITRKAVSSNLEVVPETVYVDRTPIKLLYAATAIQASIDVYCDEEFVISSGQLIQVDTEYMLVGTPTIAYDGGSGKWRGNLTVTRAKNYTLAAAHLIDAVVTANEVCSAFQPPDEYLTFNFALTRQQKVQIVVGVLHRKHTLAYVMEEKILDAGVYKRENGIRWDGGINFAKVWPESVNKIYLMPNDSFNYMYNRMFHIGATTGWEDAKYNFYWWQFDQDIKAGYPDSGNVANATSAGWIKTATQYDASLIIKPVLNGFSGNASIIATERKTIAIKTNCHTYKLKWKAPIPPTSFLSSYQPVSLPIQIKTDAGAYQDINDAVYFDAYVSTADGGNVNLMNTTTTNTETARRWVVPIGLNQIIQWDFTDSQGKTVTAGSSATGTGYKMTILNVFDIYGEGVEVIVDGAATNLIDGSMKPIQIEYGNFFANNPMWTINKWSIVGQGKGEPNDTSISANQNMQNGPWSPFRNGGTTITNITKVNYIEQPTGGQTGTDGYIQFAFWKSNKVTAWDKNDKKLSAPALLKHALEQTIKISTEVDNYYFRMFTLSTKGSMGKEISGVTLNQIWNPYLFIEYRDNTETRECKIKYFKLTIDETRDLWKTCSVVLSRTVDLSDVDIIQAVGVELRCLDTEAPSALLEYVAMPPGTNNPVKEYLGIDSVEFGTGATVPPTYTDPAGSPRTSAIFYLKD